MSLSATSVEIRGDRAAVAREILAHAKGVLLDWDGCIAFENQPDSSALRFLAEWQDRVAIVSNNSTNLPGDFAQILARTGVEIPPERIFLAGVETVKRARETDCTRVLFLGDTRMRAFGRNSGLNLVQTDASLVLLLRDTRITYARLERAANCLRHGARLLVSNPDATHRGRKGRLVPETGAILAALQTCAGTDGFEMEIIGKPSDRLFGQACAALGIRADDAVMIGDTPSTDAAGALAFGMPHILIGCDSGLEFQELLRVERLPFRTA